MKKLLLTLAALAVTSPAVADLICAQCEYATGAAGSYLGAFDPATNDRATFQHLTFEQGRFNDFWVFDVGPASASASALVAALGSITVFVAELFQDAGSVCPAFACTSVELGQRLDVNASIDGAIGLFNFIQPGRYVLHVTGVIAPPRENIYRGFLEIGPISIREAGSLGLMGLGLVAIGLLRRRIRAEPR